MDISMKKKIVIAVGGVVAAIFLAVVVFLLSFDINSYKPRIEAEASQATGLEVSVKGKMGLSFFPFGVSAGDVRLSAKGAEIAVIEKLNIGVELTPLLKKQIKVTVCELVRPVITVEQLPIGIIASEGTKKKSGEEKTGQSFSLNELRLTDGKLVYLDGKAGIRNEINDFNLTLKAITIDDTSADIIRTVSFTGNFDSKTVVRKDLRISNLKATIKAGNGIFSFEPVRMDIFDAKAEGTIAVDKSGSETVYKMNFSIPKLDMVKLQESFGAKKTLGGKADLETALAIREKGARKLTSGLEGSFSLQGDNLIMYTMDLDKTLTAYSKTQDFNLVDLGSFFVAGPLGAVAAKGYHYGDVYSQTRGGQGSIRRLVSRWNIKNGKAESVDCALSTENNRVALKGRLNLVEERYENVTVALLDEKGCAKMKQSVSGPFSNPKLGTVSAAESLASPIFSLYRKAKSVVSGGKCEVFYKGAVRHPR